MANDDFDRMLRIAKKQAVKIDIPADRIYEITELFPNATGTVRAGHFIALTPHTFKRAYDSRLGRYVSARENLKRTLLHEWRHIWQAKVMPEKYWNPEYREELEQDAYSHEDSEIY